MAVDGYPLQAFGAGNFAALENWLNNAEATYDAAFLVNVNDTEFNVSTTLNFEAGENVTVTGTYNATGSILYVTNNQTGKKIGTNIANIGTGTGSIFVDGGVDFMKETPLNYLRQIKVQITMSGPAVVEGTLNDGLLPDWFVLNNGVALDGLSVITMFVTSNSILNFRTAAGSNAIDVDVIIAAA